MRDPGALYELVGDSDDVPAGLHLVAGLTGFTDSGSAVSQLIDYLGETIETRDIAVFENDALLDYRARRPSMYFDGDHLSEYRPARLVLQLAHDELHRPFLLLTGYEPDFQWEAFTQAVVDLVDRFQVADTTWIHSIPMPTPHTRPIGVTVSGNRTDLTDAYSIWRPRTQVPGNALHLVEYRLQQKGHLTAGFVLLIPHYLADTEYPAAAVAALESISAATGLIFPTDDLREQSREFMQKVEEQVGGNAELERLVATLEARHDSYMEENPIPSPLVDESGELPNAETIAAELERFLASRREDPRA
ncbi:proteasome assembly chaperone family protein [Homoserinibacter sp. GY 40078]|uniref:proteasome assembly chaperone family protein n=1 Tax=Homoserinibacter sp. GY 40078 TaxID=2603275 RepID=UPI0011CC13A6|nr:PAC2 family protein [Homoserinibacter sp. GY 40078]TXK17477.1 PAC2 family protein [Homoserinibacter sp. GY 40078]